MSAEEDTELRDLVTQTLEANGVLGRIRAELRASVFLALEEQNSTKSKTSFCNPALKQFLSTKEGHLTVSLVKEFLEYFTLDFTSSVFTPESDISDSFEGRDTLAKEIGIVDNDKTKSKPLLSELLKRSSDEKHGRHRSWSGAEDYIPKELTEQQIADAREKFTEYDKDNSGSIEKEELRTLFSDMFPHFHRNMLDRYVNDEFKAVDRDFSNAIDFHEFLGMYRRLFVLCRSVVSHDVSELVPTSPRVKPLKTIKESKIPVLHKKTGSDSKASSKAHADDDSLKDPFPDISQPTTVLDKRPASNGEEAPKPSRDAEPESSLFLKKKSGGNGVPSPSLRSDAGHGASSMSSLSGAPLLGGGASLGSLKNAPPLPGMSLAHPAKDEDGSKTPDLKEVLALEDQIKELEFTNPKNDGDNYEDDFYSSQGSQSQQSKHSASDVNNEKNDDDPISEEIEEDISFDDDFLESSNDKFDDLTTDRTASQQSGNGLDFIEDVMALP